MHSTNIPQKDVCGSVSLAGGDNATPGKASAPKHGHNKKGKDEEARSWCAAGYLSEGNDVVPKG